MPAGATVGPPGRGAGSETVGHKVEPFRVNLRNMLVTHLLQTFRGPLPFGQMPVIQQAFSGSATRNFWPPTSVDANPKKQSCLMLR
jgi:hypothetical protein